MVEVKFISDFQGSHDVSRCSCGGRAVAVLTMDYVSVPMCLSCLDDLIRTSHSARGSAMMACHSCKHYLPHPEGYDFCGRCALTDGERHYMDGNKGWLHTCDSYEQAEG